MKLSETNPILLMASFDFENCQPELQNDPIFTVDKNDVIFPIFGGLLHTYTQIVSLEETWFGKGRPLLKE